MARLMLVSWEAKARNTVELASTSRTIWAWLWLSAVLRRWSELTSWRRSVPRTATALLSRARSRCVGSKRSNTWASSVPPLPFRPWPAPLTSSWR